MAPVQSLEPLEVQGEPQLADPDSYLPSDVPLDPQVGTGGILRKIVVLIVILAIVGFAGWKINRNLGDTAPKAGGKERGGGEDRVIPVTTAAVQQKTMPIYLTGLGTVTAYYSVTIKTRVDGQLKNVTVREGQNIRKGQLLAEIDRGPYAAALAQAEGQYSRDKASAAYADVEAARYTSLFDAGVVSKDSQQTRVAAAGESAGALQADRAAIQAAQVNLDYTRIVSPIDGVVGLRQVDPGNIVHAADATGLLLVTQLQPIAVIFTLPEDQLPQVQEELQKGTKLTVEAYDRSQTKLLAVGKLLTLDNQIDTTTGTDKVKAVFDNKDHVLFPNQFVNARLILQERPNTLVIPAAAVQSGSQGNFVYVVKKGDPPAPNASAGKGGSADAGPGHKHEHAAAGSAVAPAPRTGDKVPADMTTDKSDRKYYVEVRPITAEVAEGSQVIIGSGLSAGDQVVIDGLEKLKNGSRVSPKKSDSIPDHKSSGGSKVGTDATAPAPDGKGRADDKKKSVDRSRADADVTDGVAPHEHSHHHKGLQP